VTFSSLRISSSLFYSLFFSSGKSSIDVRRMDGWMGVLGTFFSWTLAALRYIERARSGESWSVASVDRPIDCYNVWDGWDDEE
jgi:hypothetical protein